MTILNRNIEAIAATNPGLAERLGREAGGVEIEETRSGDRTFRFSGRYFHSRYDPWKEADLQAEEVVERKPDWVVLFGLGCGYLLRTLIDKGLAKVIIFEPSLEILKGVMDNVDLSGALSGEDVYLFDSPVELVQLVRTRVEGMDTLISCQIEPYKHTFPSELMDLLNRVQNAHTTSKVGIKTDIDSRLSWIENYLDNVEVLKDIPPIDVFSGRFEGLPMVIVGAGPSLGKNAHLLKEMKGRAVIIAAATAYRPLLNFGVVPDFVIACEKIDMKEYFSAGESDREIRMILAEVAHPEMLRMETGRKYVFFNPFMSLSLEHGRLWGSGYFANIGGSVTTAALDMGVMFGCDPIIFIGQDLAFGESGSHVEGGVYSTHELKIDEETGEGVLDWDYTGGKTGTINFKRLWLPGVDGNPVASKFDWVTFHQWFEVYLDMMRTEGLANRVINATEGGAYIEGMEHMSLREAINIHVKCSVNLEEIERVALAERTPADPRAITESFEKMHSSLEKIEGYADRIVKEIGRTEKEIRRSGLTPGLARNVKRMKGFEQKLFDETSKARFVWEALSEYTYALKEYLREERPGGETERFMRDLESTAVSYRKVKEICRRFKPRVEAAGKAASRAGGEGRGKELVNG